MLRSLGLWIAMGLGLASFPVRTLGEPLARADVPTPLAPWVDWVLRGAEDAACALVRGSAEIR